MTVHLEPWSEDDLPLLERIMGDAAMMAHLGGPETRQQIVDRQKRYERLTDSGLGIMFRIVDTTTRDAVGSVGYWERTWDSDDVYEMGWSVLPPFQGRGIARNATAQAVAAARSDGKHRWLYAFPSIDNGPSNGICRALGFTLVEEREFEYPPGNVIACNVWRLDLHLPHAPVTTP